MNKWPPRCSLAHVSTAPFVNVAIPSDDSSHGIRQFNPSVVINSFKERKLPAFTGMEKNRHGFAAADHWQQHVQICYGSQALNFKENVAFQPWASKLIRTTMHDFNVWAGQMVQCVLIVAVEYLSVKRIPRMQLFPSLL